MSLPDAQTARAGQDLRRHLEVSDLTRQQLCEWLDLSPSELEHVLQMDGHAHPVTTWLVRDALDQAVAESGADGTGPRSLRLIDLCTGPATIVLGLTHTLTNRPLQTDDGQTKW